MVATSTAPTSRIIAQTKEGFAAWLEENPIDTMLHSRFVIQDSGGRGLSIASRQSGLRYDHEKQTTYENSTEKRTKEQIFVPASWPLGSVSIGFPGFQQQLEIDWIDSKEQRVQAFDRKELPDGTNKDQKRVSQQVGPLLSYHYAGTNKSNARKEAKNVVDGNVAVFHAGVHSMFQPMLQLPSEW